MLSLVNSSSSYFQQFYAEDAKVAIINIQSIFNNITGIVINLITKLKLNNKQFTINKTK
jgi:hypothetical protein